MNVAALHKRLDNGPWTEQELNERIRVSANIPAWDNAGVSAARAMLQNAGGIRLEQVGDEPPFAQRWVKTDFPKPLSEPERWALAAKQQQAAQDHADEIARRLHAPPPLTYATLDRQQRDMVEVVLRHHNLIP